MSRPCILCLRNQLAWRGSGTPTGNQLSADFESSGQACSSSIGRSMENHCEIESPSVTNERLPAV